MSRGNSASICLIFLMSIATTATASPIILNEWKKQYPSSTLPARMHSLTGTECHVCHHPPVAVQGNCYREDIKALLSLGRSPAEAIAELDGEDSDNDGVPNGVEATAPRVDQPGEIGYNPGLVGATGTDPCSLEPAIVVTGELETPPPPPAIPATSQWGQLLIALAMLTAGSLVLRRNGRVA